MTFVLFVLQLGGHKVPLEVCLLRKVSHIDGVIKLLDYYERNDSFIIIMERPEPVKDLFDYITEKGILEEEVARCFFRQIIETLILCHKAGVVHRDIKVIYSFIHSYFFITLPRPLFLLSIDRFFVSSMQGGYQSICQLE